MIEKLKQAHVWRLVLCGGAAAGLAGCVSRSPTTELPHEFVPGAFSQSGSNVAPERWWTTFDDAQLNQLVTRALDSNLTVQAAWQRLRQAQAIVDRESALFFPDLQAEAEAGVQRPQFENDDGGDTHLRLGLSSQYEVDLWGRIRSGVDAERYRAHATLADYQTIALTVAAEVARTWYQLTEASNQVDVLAKQIAANEQVLELIETQFGRGQGRSVDVLRQRQLIAATREQRIVAEARVQVLRHLLAVLLGRPPQDGIDAEPATLPELPPLPATGLPANLVQTRPDVRAAFHRVQAADEELAAAIADRYPAINLAAVLATEGSSVESLFEEWIRALSASIVAPLFDGGERSAEIERAAAFKQELLYAYAETMLTAFREVEDALVQEAKQQERLASVREQVQLASRTYEQLRIEYLNGVGNYIDVLLALSEQQQLRRDLITEQLILLEYRISLYRALAGDFDAGRADESAPAT